MKNVRNLFLTALFAAFTFSSFAQDYNEGSLYDAVNKDKYGDNWFVSFGANVNLMLGEQDKLAPFGGRIQQAFGGQLTGGKWFNPTFGMRMQVMGGTLSGYQMVKSQITGPHNYYTTGGRENIYSHQNQPTIYWENGGPTKDKMIELGDLAMFQNPEYWKGVRNIMSGKYVKGFYQDFTYGTATVDLMANLTTLLRGHYVPDNKFDLIPFAGFGVIHAFDNHKTTISFTSIVAKIGFRANYNFNDKWAIFLEPQANATTAEFDGYQGDVIADAVLNLSLGVQYTFNKNIVPFEKLASDEIDRLNKKVNENRYLIDQHQDILERHQDLLDRLQKCCEEKPVVTTQIVRNKLPEYIRFVLDSYKIEISEQKKISDVVEYLKTNPDADLLLVGYADRQTGNPRYNWNLSQKRVEAVFNELKRLGVDPSRLKIEWKGDKEQPFSQNDWNRVVILVER
ncbi:MAG: OmpA family protein [Dysgonamonadaceae bacterium]|jgi:outer membrane protein OmpA-like peptidoglycan-associated protein|nr:OmpA family protein [Dysgonamonadaceae bacterium]